MHAEVSSSAPARTRAGHAQVRRIRFDGADLLLVLDAPGQVVARRREDGASVAGGHGRLDLRTLSDGTWDLYRGEARIARRGDGIHRKRSAVVLPAVGRAQPFFAEEDGLSVRVADPPRAEPARASRRRRWAPVAVVIHRLAMAVLVPLLRPRAGSNQPPRVRVLVLNAFGMGGTVRISFDLAQTLCDRHETEIVSLVRRSEKPFFAPPDGVPVTTLARGRGPLSRIPSLLMHPDDRAYGWCSLATDVALVRALRRWQGTLVTTRPGLNLLAARLAGPGLRVVGQEHLNFTANTQRLTSDARRHYGRLAALTVLTEDDRADYDGFAPVVEHIPNGSPAPRAQAALEAKVIVAAGRLNRQKGFDLLIPAFAQVAREHPDWQLRIYGAGLERPALGRLIVEHGLWDQVFLMGRARDLSKQLLQASVFALPSRWEGFGLALVEAMRHGLPGVAFDCPRGPGEIITDGVDGILVPDGDVVAFGNALSRLVDDERLRRQMGAAAAHSARRFGIEPFAERWEALLGRL